MRPVLPLEERYISLCEALRGSRDDRNLLPARVRRAPESGERRPVRARRRGGGGRLPRMPALPSVQGGRPRRVEWPRARLPGGSDDPRRRPRQRHGGDAGRSPRRLCAAPPPPVHEPPRCHAGRAGAICARAFRAPPARRYRPDHPGSRIRRRLRKRPSVQPCLRGHLSRIASRASRAKAYPRPPRCRRRAPLAAAVRRPARLGRAPFLSRNTRDSRRRVRRGRNLSTDDRRRRQPRRPGAARRRSRPPHPRRASAALGRVDAHRSEGTPDRGTRARSRGGDGASRP